RQERGADRTRLCSGGHLRRPDRSGRLADHVHLGGPRHESRRSEPRARSGPGQGHDAVDGRRRPGPRARHSSVKPSGGLMKSILALLALLLPSVASAQLEWRISIKLFTGSGGALPPNPNWGVGPSIYQSITNDVVWVNGILDGTGRGYRWRLPEIVTGPGTTAPLPATTNSWFNLPVGAGTQDDLDSKVKSNAAGFAFRNNAINFYYVNAVNGPNGGYCSFPTEGQDTILVAPNSFQDVLLHESGHFF